MCNIHLVSMKSFVHSISTPLPVLKFRIFGQKKKLTAQEMEKRKDEETLFSGSLAGAPTLLSNINDVLQHDDLEAEETDS